MVTAYFAEGPPVAELLKAMVDINDQYLDRDECQIMEEWMELDEPSDDDCG